MQRLKWTNALPKSLVADAKTIGNQSSSVDPASVFTASRQIYHAHFSYVEPSDPGQAHLISLVPENFRLIGMEPPVSPGGLKEVTQVLSGQGTVQVLGQRPWALAYGGHQFGQWAGQLGDGRAMTVGQVIGADGCPWEIQLKGAGRTPYSRFADGYAVLRSSIREFLVAEGMHALGVPTSRSLALVVTPDRKVQRETLETGAIVTRIANGWIRFGNFELLYARGDIENLRVLADFTLKHHFGLEKGEYAKWLQIVISSTADMIAHWQAVGFCHGVMNTDNFSILGITIDYGPFQFLDAYDSEYVCNHSDETGLYSFDAQPKVGLWNLARLCTAVSPLFSDIASDSDRITKELASMLEAYMPRFKQTYVELMSRKFGFASGSDATMEHVVQPFLDLIEKYKIDYTLSLRQLSRIPSRPELASGDLQAFKALAASDDLAELDKDLHAWWKMYIEHCRDEPERQARMLNANPKYVLRNSIVQQVIQQAESGDYSAIDEYLQVLQNPFDEGTEIQDTKFAQPIPKTQQGIKCSCSS